MRKTRKLSQSGATLSEYAFLTGLVVIACIAALNLLGQTTSDLLGGVTTGQTGKQMNSLVRLEFNSQEQGSSEQLAVSGTPGSLKLTESTGTGTNVSSMEGNIVNIANAPPSVNEALTAAQRFDTLANTASTPEAALLYRQIANNAYFLASMQANYEVNVNGKDVQPLKVLARTVSGSISGGVLSRINTSLKAIDDGMLALKENRTLITNSTFLTSAEKKEALLMIDVAISASTAQYGNTMLYNPAYKLSASIKQPTGAEMANLREVAVSVSTSKDLPPDSAVTTSIQTGINLDNKVK